MSHEETGDDAPQVTELTAVDNANKLMDQENAMEEVQGVKEEEEGDDDSNERHAKRSRLSTNSNDVASPSPTDNGSRLKTEWISNGSLRVHLPPQYAHLLVSGRGYLSSVQGSLDVQGYRLSAGQAPDERIPFDCPQQWWNWLTLSNPTNETIVLQLDSLHLHSATSLTVNTTTAATTQPHEPSLQATFELHPHTPRDNVAENNHRPTHVSDEWKAVSQQILQDWRSPKPEPDEKEPLVVAICGAKGVGKSNFVRYLLHLFLSDPRPNPGSVQVSLLDADLGQPEFSPPGLVSLTTHLTRPLFSPPHMHMTQQARDKGIFGTGVQKMAYFLSSTSPTHSDPTAYLESIGSLYQHYRNYIRDGHYDTDETNGINHNTRDEKRKQILLVNMDGWVKGLGGELLVTMLQQTLQPTHVVQIQGLTPSQQFDLSSLQNHDSMALHVVSTYQKYCHNPPLGTSETNTNQTESQDNDNNVESGKDDDKTFTTLMNQRQSPPTLTAATMRTLRLCTYFLNYDLSMWERISAKSSFSGLNDETLQIPQRLAALPPYVVPLEAVSLFNPAQNGKEEDPSELYAWNASIVGLCSRPDDTLPWYLLPCAGLGLIRSIDLAQKLLYILTPVHPKELANVTVLVKSQNIAVPLEMTFRGGDSESFPYIQQIKNLASNSDADEVILGAAPIKSRNTIGRRPYQARNG